MELPTPHTFLFLVPTHVQRVLKAFCFSTKLSLVATSLWPHLFHILKLPLLYNKYPLQLFILFELLNRPENKGSAVVKSSITHMHARCVDICKFIDQAYLGLLISSLALSS